MRYTTLLFTIILISCQQKQSTEEKTSVDFEFYPYIPDSLVTKSETLKQIKESGDFFNLPDLFKGTKDSLEIRVWPWDTFNWFKNVFIFKFNDSNWVGYHYFSYTMPIIDQDGKLITFTDIKKIGDSVFLVKQITSLCGWEKFSDSLEYYKIKTLPTQGLIKNFEHKAIMDGDGVSMEIATKKSYRILSYSHTSSYEYEECKLVEGFMKMLKRQLGNNYYWPREWLYAKSIK